MDDLIKVWEDITMELDSDLINRANQAIIDKNRQLGVLKRQLKTKGHPAYNDFSEFSGQVSALINQYVAMTNMFNSGHKGAEQWAIDAKASLIEAIS